jgi:AcrR family transcriptional regulator
MYDMTEGAQSSGIRRVPRQARSQAKVALILDTADSILGNEGFESVTSQRIAVDAGIPIGTVYQFFADKNGIVDALALRYIAEFDDLMLQLVASSLESHWSDLVDTVFDAFVDQYRSNPGYLTLWLGRHLSSDVRLADDANNDMLAVGLRSIIAAQENLPEDDDLLRCCRVGIHIGDAMLQMAFRLSPQGDPQIIAEAKHLERLYLSEFISR